MKNGIFVVGYTSFGEIEFLIDGKSYTYQVKDGAWVSQNIEKYKRNPGKLLNLVKKKCIKK